MFSYTRCSHIVRVVENGKSDICIWWTLCYVTVCLFWCLSSGLRTRGPLQQLSCMLHRRVTLFIARLCLLDNNFDVVFDISKRILMFAPNIKMYKCFPNVINNYNRLFFVILLNYFFNVFNIYSVLQTFRTTITCA